MCTVFLNLKPIRLDQRADNSGCNCVLSATPASFIVGSVVQGVCMCVTGGAHIWPQVTHPPPPPHYNIFYIYLVTSKRHLTQWTYIALQ